MPQTIAMQRGTVSTNWTVNGTSASTTTLFTQSSGTATRVICNFLGLNTNYNGSGNIIFYLANASGVSVPIGACRQGSSWFNVAIIPSESRGVGVGSTYFQGATFFQQGNAAATSLGLSNPNNTLGGSVSDPSHMVYFPKNIWMGNGDSITVRGFVHATATTTTVDYNFTTITES
jgi:hypothetical protein